MQNFEKDRQPPVVCEETIEVEIDMWKEWIKGLFALETTHDKREIGRDVDGELSSDALFRWVRWSVVVLAICVVITCGLSSVSSVRDRKESAILEVDSGEVLEFYLNRKGTVLKAKGDAENILNNYSLEDGIEKILQGLLEHGLLGEDGAVIMTLRACENGVKVDLGRFSEEIHVYAEAFLRKKHSNGKIYVCVLESGEDVFELAENYGVSKGKAALVQDLVNENRLLRGTDIERLIRKSVTEISSEMDSGKYETSFLKVVAKHKYAQMLEIEKTDEVPETESEIVPETIKESEKEPKTLEVRREELPTQETTQMQTAEKSAGEGAESVSAEGNADEEAAEEAFGENGEEAAEESFEGIGEEVSEETDESIQEVESENVMTEETYVQPETETEESENPVEESAENIEEEESLMEDGMAEEEETHGESETESRSEQTETLLTSEPGI